MIKKLLKSLRKFVCSKLKTYKRSRYRCIQPPPPTSPESNRTIRMQCELKTPNTLECKVEHHCTAQCEQEHICMPECEPEQPSMPDASHKRSTSKRHHTIKEIKEQKICFNPGNYTRNPFLNFLREYRKKHCGLTVVEQAVQAGAEWRCMTREQKCKYYVQTDGGKPSRRRRYKRKHIYWIKK